VRQGAGRLLARVGLDLRPGEGTTTALLFCSLLGIITFQYVTKTVRQSTFVDSLGATRLPYVYLLVALTAYPFLRFYLRLAEQFSRRSLMQGSLLATALSMGVFWWLLSTGGPWVSMAFYVWVSLTFVALVSQFWAITSHALDSRQARRLFGLIGAGGLLGSVAGGQVARLAAESIGAEAALLLAGFILVVVALLQVKIREAPPAEVASAGDASDQVNPVKQARRSGEVETNGAAQSGGLRLLWASAHLRMIGVVLLLSVLVAQTVDLQFSWAVEQATTGLGERTAWFGNFFSAMGVAAFLFQIFFTARIHTVLGVGVALRVLPVAVILGTVVLMGAAGFLPEAVLAAALSLKLGENGLRYSLDQSTRELLFMPVPAAGRLRAKAIIDVFLQRSGKGLAALFLLPVAFGWVAPIQAGWLSLILCIAWLVAAGQVAHTYVSSFRAALNDGAAAGDENINLGDVRTVELLVQSLGSTDTRQVLHSLQILRANGRQHLVPPLLLYHDDAGVRLQTLQILAEVDRKDTAPLVERCLADEDPEVRAEAISVLTRFNAADACVLMRPRLQEGEPRVRAAAVTCLLNHGSSEEVEAAATSLTAMLHDADPEVRGEGVKAMGAVRGQRFESSLVGALDDASPAVAREAIHAVRRLVAREGFRPLFLPRLISHLRDRRLKADARDALVAFGTDAIPILMHFINDREESAYVRRALPRVVARIPDASVPAALVTALVAADDTFLRAQIVEALASRQGELADLSAKIEKAIQHEAGSYLARLADVVALAPDESLRFQGPVLHRDRQELSLLLQMIAERLEDHLRTLFGMLALIHPPEDVWAAWRSLISGRSGERADALEYLDNTLSGDLRRHVFAVIDDSSPAEKLRRASRLYALPGLTGVEAVRRLVEGGLEGDADARALATAGLYTLYTEAMKGLYSLVDRMDQESNDPVIVETAAWVSRQLARDAGRG